MRYASRKISPSIFLAIFLVGMLSCGVSVTLLDKLEYMTLPTFEKPEPEKKNKR